MALTEEEAIQLARECLRARRLPPTALYNVVEDPDSFLVLFEPVSPSVFGGLLVVVDKVTRDAVISPGR